MRYLPTGEQMREADRYTITNKKMPSVVLMERAALQVTEVIENRIINFQKIRKTEDAVAENKMIQTKQKTTILVVCGSGNNGGDGYAIARLLHLKGYKVALYFAGKEESRSEENRLQKQISQNYHVPIVNSLEDAEYSIIVDALFGTGLTREITGSYRALIEKLNQMLGVKVAVDIPSGIHDTTGEIMGIAFRADITVAIAFTKRGLVLSSGNVYAGEIITVDIGIPPSTFQNLEDSKSMFASTAMTEDGRSTFAPTAMTEDSKSRFTPMTITYEKEDLAEKFPKRKPNSHKGTYGKVLLIVGSKGMSGAAYLSAKAAYAVGAGLVQIYTAEENRVVLQQLLPEAILTTYQQDVFNKEQLMDLIAWADVVGIGCGLGKSKWAEQCVACTLEQVKVRNIPCVIDADGLNLLSEHLQWLEYVTEQVILTPHMKEMTRLLHCEMKDLSVHRFAYVEAFAKQYGCVVALKDARTIVCKEGEDEYLNLSGNAAMAKGGSGDVLAGMLAGILAQHIESYQAACVGVYLHGLAGDAARDKKGVYSVLASDIIDGIGEVLKELK